MIEARDLVMDYTAGMARVQADHSVTGVMPRGAGTGGSHPYAAGGTGYAMPAVHTLALNHVNFDLAPGETVAVMGPSGSGKSTLLHALAGIIRPTSGTVTFQGANLTAMSDADRTKLRRGAFGFVFQSGQLLPELPAVENIALPMMLDGADYRSATDAAMLWLERLGLRQLASQRPGEMSGGPTGALDQATGREVMSILMEAARDNGAAVVIVTHDPNVAGFCGRTMTMQDGRLSQTAEAGLAPAGGVRHPKADWGRPESAEPPSVSLHPAVPAGGAQ